MLTIEREPKSLENEAYVGLKANIEYSFLENKYRIIVISSSLPCEGKTTVASNLALSMAKGNKRVLLVDCDLRKPSVHKEMNLSNNRGLIDILRRNAKLEDIKQKYSGCNNLDVITTGKGSESPAELLESAEMKKFIENSKELYDYVIIDSSPIKVFNDSIILATKADGVLLVVKSDSTKRNDIVDSVNMIKSVNGKVLGLILNGKKQKKNKYYDYYLKK